MKVFFNRHLRRTPWGGGVHFATGLADYLEHNGHKATTEYEDDVDVILMLDPRDDEGFGRVEHLISYKKHLREKGRNVKVVHRINDTDVARGTNFLVDLNIKANSAIADETVFISSWLKNHYEDRGFSRNSSVITNGCNQKWFYPRSTNSIEGPVRVVTHHWSDNYNKGFDAYIELDKQLSHRSDIEFTYVGRYFKGYAPTNTKIIQPLYGMPLADELRKHDVYLTAARWEACGMHHIEASSCGLPVVYHRDGGGINEVCESHGIQFEDPSRVCDVILEAFKQRIELSSKIAYEKLDSDQVNAMYLKVLSV